MFSNIKRVISNPDEIGSKEKMTKTNNHGDSDLRDDDDVPTEAAKILFNETSKRFPDAADTTRGLPAVVECDDGVETPGVPLVTRPNSSVSTASSVSDHSERGGANRDETMPDAPHDIGTRGLVRSESPMSRPHSHKSTDSLASTRTGATSSRDLSGNWGWFEDVHGAEGSQNDLLKIGKDGESAKKLSTKGKKSTLLHQYAVSEPLNDNMMRRSIDNAAMAVTAPNYVLEESLSSQKLWKDTAGNRPPQPVEERAFFEKMWAQNFARSQVDYRIPVEVLTASSPISLSPFADSNFDEGTDGRRSDMSNYNLPSGDESRATVANPHLAEATLINRLHDPSRPGYDSNKAKGKSKLTVKGTDSEGDLTVLVKGDNVFGTTVSKSFALDDKGGAVSGVDTVNVSIASYRVVDSKKYGKYAQFLVIYREGSIRDTVGVWKRYSDFVELSRLVTSSHEGCSSVLANMSPLSITEEQEVEHLPNAITSWRLLKKRQRWYRCLDAGYLSLKVFLLERFLHDILFESSSPKILRDFALGA